MTHHVRRLNLGCDDCNRRNHQHIHTLRETCLPWELDSELWNCCRDTNAAADSTADTRPIGYVPSRRSFAGVPSVTIFCALKDGGFRVQEQKGA